MMTFPFRGSTRTNSRRRRGQRGASAVEAAIVIAALTIPAVEVVDYMTDEQAEILVDHGDRIGMPSESAGYPRTPSGNGSNNSGDGDVGDGNVESSLSYAITTYYQSNNGQYWTAQIEMTVTDPSGNPVSNGTIEGFWLQTDGTTVSASCLIDLSGTCTVQLSDIDGKGQDQITAVQFTVSHLESNSLYLSPTAVRTSGVIEEPSNSSAATP